MANAAKTKTRKVKTQATVRDFDILRTPVVTEKAHGAQEQNKLTFQVSPCADKGEVKSAVERVFKVKVEKVNILTQKGKNKRFRGVMGTRDSVKKAIVTLQEGETADIAAGV